MENRGDGRYIRNQKYKSFIKAGDGYLDIKNCVGFKLMKDPKGFVSMQCFFKEKKEPLYFKIKDENQLSLLFLELEFFFDDPNLLASLRNLMDDILEDS